MHVLLEAIQNTSLRVVIAGTGPLEIELKQKAEQLGLKNVQFVGYVADHDKAALFKLARAMVFPSLFRSEAFGVSLVESAMYGLPMISTEIGTGTSYVNEKDITGLIVPPGDKDALRQAMITMDGDDAMCKTMGENARKRFEKLFTAEQMGRKYFLLYNSLYKQQGNATAS